MNISFIIFIVTCFIGLVIFLGIYFSNKNQQNNNSSNVSDSTNNDISNKSTNASSNASNNASSNASSNASRDASSNASSDASSNKNNDPLLNKDESVLAGTIIGTVAIEGAAFLAQSVLDKAAAKKAAELVAKETGELAAKETGELVAKETGELIAKETGELALKETGELVAKETGELVAKETGELALKGTASELTATIIGFDLEKSFATRLARISIYATESAALKFSNIYSTLIKIVKYMDKFGALAINLARLYTFGTKFEQTTMSLMVASMIRTYTASTSITNVLNAKIGEQLASKVGVKVGEEVSSQVGVKVGEKVSTSISTTASTAIAKTVAEESMAASALSLVGGKVGLALLFIQMAMLTIDIKDVAGYNILIQMEVVNKLIKKNIQRLITAISDTTGEDFIYPATIGPIDILMGQLAPTPTLNPTPTLTPSTTLTPTPTEPELPQSMYAYLLLDEIPKIMKDSSIPIIKTYIDTINNKKNNNASNEELGNYINDFLNTNIDLLVDIATKRICIANGGFMTNDTIPYCSFTKENCVNKIIPPNNNCVEEIDPIQSKCSNKTIYKCNTELLTIAEGDVDKAWSINSGKCLSVNGGIKTICETNGLKYNIDTDMCLMTKEACLSKAGTPIYDDNGNVKDCNITTGQLITEALFGMTLTRSLIQTFDEEQYKCPKEGLLDLAKKELGTSGPIGDYLCSDKCAPGTTYGSYMCHGTENGTAKCDPGYHLINPLCWADNHTSKLTLPGPNKCPDGYKLEGLGPLCIKQNCKEGDREIGALCRNKCIDGFHEIAGVCWSNKSQLQTEPVRAKCDNYYTFNKNTNLCEMDGIKPRGTGTPPTICKDGDKSKGITCEACHKDYINNGATLCYKPCKDGFVHDGTMTCNKKNYIGVPFNDCPDGYENKSGICYKKCNSDEKTKNLLCEKCIEPDYTNNGSSLCYKPCDNGYTYDGIKTCNAKDVKYNGTATICPDGYNYYGLKCYSKSCPDGYIYDGKASCTRDDKKVYSSDAEREKTCNDLSSVVYGVGTCTGTKSKCRKSVFGTWMSCPVTRESKYLCSDTKTKLGGKCYDKCPDNYNYNSTLIPTFCKPKNDKGLVIPQMDTKNPGCPSSQDLVGSGCYDKCPTGMKHLSGVPTKCESNTNSKGMSYYTNTSTVISRARDSEVSKGCTDGYENIASLCYEKCPEGSSRKYSTPTICTDPNDKRVSYTTDTATARTYPAKCKENEDAYNSLCYKKCRDVYNECFIHNPTAPAYCMPKNGLTYSPNINGCQEGYVLDNQIGGVRMCKNNYIPKTYSKETITASCIQQNGKNRDEVGGSCYEECGSPAGIQLGHQDGLPTQCVPERGGKHPSTYTALKSNYFPQTYPKIRAAEYSHK